MDDVKLDGWLLTATQLAGGQVGARLAAVVDAGDYLDHSIFELHELEAGYGRLAAHGLVVVATDPALSVRLTAAGVALLARATGKDHIVTAFTNAPRELAAWYTRGVPMLGIPTIDWAAEHALVVARYRSPIP